MTLFNFETRGTRLRPLFLFLSSIIQDKITTLHISQDEIRCSETSYNKRILFNYVLDSKKLVNYEYNFKDEITKLRFELKWLNDKLQEVKIKNIDAFASIIRLGGKKVFWLHTYHPNNWGAFNKHRAFNKETGVAEGWEFYAEHIFNFISEKNA